MSSQLTDDQFSIGIDRLVQEGLILPYGFPAGSFPGGTRRFNTVAEWNDYQFNPPGFLFNDPRFSAFSIPDPEAGSKPSWNDIVKAWKQSQPMNLRADKLAELNLEATTRITRAYGESNFDDEIKLRLGNRHTSKQDQERDRLKALHGTLRDSINISTLEELEALDIADDAIWVST